jgi:transposase
MNAKYNLDGIERANGENPIKKAPGPKKTAKKKGGRPKKAESEKLTERVSVVLTKDEFTALQTAASNKYPMELPINTLIRTLLKETGIFNNKS